MNNSSQIYLVAIYVSVNHSMKGYQYLCVVITSMFHIYSKTICKCIVFLCRYFSMAWLYYSSQHLIDSIFIKVKLFDRNFDKLNFKASIRYKAKILK